MILGTAQFLIDQRLVFELAEFAQNAFNQRSAVSREVPA